MIQHLVSRGLLRRFANHHNGPISGLDLDTLVQRTDKVKNFGGVEDTDLQAPDDIENVWNNEVEMRLPYAFQLLDSGEVLANSDAVSTLKNCTILHWARGHTLRVVSASLTPSKADEVTASVLARFTPAHALNALTGSRIVTPSDAERVREVIRTKFAEMLRQERFLDEQFLQQYRIGQKLIADKALEIWHSPSDEFLMGDIPVVSYDKDTDQVGILNGVSWDKADAIFMPLGPHHVVALSKKYDYKEADARMVERLNVYQVRCALKEVFFRPDSGLGDIIANALRQNQQNN